jgi:hypothetical protein
MRPLIILPVLAVALAACEQSADPLTPNEARPAFLSSVENTVSREQFDFFGFAECVGEPLHLTGEVLVRFHRVTAEETGTVQHFLFALTAHGTAVGLESGNFYRFHEVHRTTSNSPSLTALQGVTTEFLTTHLVGAGSVPNAIIRLAFHQVFNGQGLEKILVDSDKTSCPVDG